VSVFANYRKTTVSWLWVGIGGCDVCKSTKGTIGYSQRTADKIAIGKRLGYIYKLYRCDAHTELYGSIPQKNFGISLPIFYT